MIGTFIRNAVLATFIAALCSVTVYAQGVKYPSLSKERVILEGDSGKWDENKIHTLSVVEANKDGYKYWGYYCLEFYGGNLSLRKAGLARSNDLVHWKKYSGNPIITEDCRWPTVVMVHSKFYMFYEEYDYLANDSRIVMVTSKDGIHFGNKVVVVPRETEMQNQNPFIYYNKRDGNFYLFYYSGIEKSRDSLSNNWNIMVKKSRNINKLKDANPMLLITSRFTMAAPSIAYHKGRYYLTVEALNLKTWLTWVTLAYSSDKIEGKYTEVANNPVLVNNDPCAFQYIFHNQLYIFYSHQIKPHDPLAKDASWDIRMVKAVR
jgi:hypothetical protein